MAQQAARDVPLNEAEKLATGLVVNNKLAKELLKKVTALQTKLQMIDQV
jgi:hypothetical protein